ncbi:hypothetical protein MAHJHV59_49660 [Mycobacterium avium subsp. hominissuis]
MVGVQRSAPGASAGTTGALGALRWTPTKPVSVHGERSRVISGAPLEVLAS